MPKLKLADDPIGFALDLDEKKGKLISDASGFYTYYVPSPEELAALNAKFGDEIAQARLDMAPIYEEMERAKRAYEADITRRGKDLLVIPDVRRECNQAIAFLYLASLRPNPIMSVEPYFNDEYNVLIRTEVGDAQMAVTSEQLGATLEAGIDYKLRECLNILRIFWQTYSEIVTGQGPVWFKIIQNLEKKYAEAMNLKPSKTKKGIVEVSGERRFIYAKEEPTRIVTIPAVNVLVPAGYDDPQLAPWMAEITNMTRGQVRERIQFLDKLGALLVTEEKDKDVLLGAAATEGDRPRIDTDVANDKRIPKIQQGELPTVEIHFTHPLRYVGTNDVTGEEEERIEMTELVGEYHSGSRSFLGIWKNPYRHQERPYEPAFQWQRSRSLSGFSIAGDGAAMQEYKARFFNSTMENAEIANQSVITADPDGEGLDWLADNPYEAGAIIPAKDGEIKSFSVGREHRSLMPEISYLDAKMQQIASQSGMSNGEYVPARTAVDAIRTVMDAGQSQMTVTLMNVGDALSKTVKRWLKTYKQFNPYGEKIPTRDPKTNAILEIAFRMPDDEVIDNFKFSMSAADEAVTREQDLNQSLMIANFLDADAKFLADTLGPLANTQLTEGLAAAISKVVERKQLVVEDIMSRFRRDSDKFAIGHKELELITTEREQQRLAQQQPPPGPPGAPPGPGGPPQPPMDAQGGMNGETGPPSAAAPVPGGAPAPDGAVDGSAPGGVAG